MDKMRFEKEAYQRTSLLITEFDKEDVIATSTYDDETDIMIGRDGDRNSVFQTH